MLAGVRYKCTIAMQTTGSLKKAIFSTWLTNRIGRPLYDSIQLRSSHSVLVGGDWGKSPFARLPPAAHRRISFFPKFHLLPPLSQTYLRICLIYTERTCHRVFFLRILFNFTALYCGRKNIENIQNIYSMGINNALPLILVPSNSTLEKKNIS